MSLMADTILVEQHRKLITWYLTNTRKDCCLVRPGWKTCSRKRLDSVIHYCQQ